MVYFLHKSTREETYMPMEVAYLAIFSKDVARWPT